jgi:hypothetical protein
MEMVMVNNQINSTILGSGVPRGGGALGARAPPLNKKCLEGSTGLKHYSQVSNFFLLASTPLNKFLGTPLILGVYHSIDNAIFMLPIMPIIEYKSLMSIQI